ncbi:hypothetical protein EP7_002879 [Isosphaeraceae bacterium EP7]
MSQTINSPAFGTGTNDGRGDGAPASFDVLAGLYATQTRLMGELEVLGRRRARAVRQRDACGSIAVVVDAVIAQIDARRSDVLAELRANRALAFSAC